LSSATSSSSGYHSIATRIPSPRAISRLSLHTAYRHISTGDSPASESTSGLASPASAQSLLFTLSQQIKTAAAKRESGSDVSGADNSHFVGASDPLNRVGSKDETQSPTFAQTCGPELPGFARSALEVHGKHDAAGDEAAQNRPLRNASIMEECNSEAVRISASVPGSRTGRSSSVSTAAEKGEDRLSEAWQNGGR
jgi:hypothetical protein